MNLIKHTKTMSWVCIFAAFSLTQSCTPSEDDPSDGSYGATGTTGGNLAWATADNVPEPDYANFPQGYDTTADGEATNLAFHEISWQYFLWLTEEVDDNGENVLRFETLYNDAAINPDEADPKSHILGGIVQAGSNSILLDDNGRAVYTTMMINDIYRDFAIDNNLYTKEGMDMVDPELDFPPGAFSLKAAWRIVGDDEDMTGYYTKEAELYTVVDNNGSLTTSDNLSSPSEQETFTAKVALVGFHIAVVVKGHPEFIWTTFENNENAPNMVDGSIQPNEDFTFYTKGTSADACNRANAGALQVDPTSQVISLKGTEAPLTTEVFRMHQFGGGKESNQDNIKNFNDTVQELLGSSIWANYHEVGAVWFDIDKSLGVLKPDWSPTVTDTIITGSLTLSSAVIETFTQDPKDQNSCFACHNTSQIDLPGGSSLAGKNVLTSHILLQNYLDAIKESGTDVVRTKRK